MSDDNESLEFGLFEEPEGYLKKQPESHFVEYSRTKDGADPGKIQLKLVGSSPLWGHLLWNAGKYTADYLDKYSDDLVKNKKVLELGAAAGLPSLICGLNGASEVICTDYPDPDLLSHIEFNVQNCEKLAKLNNVVVKGFIWGQDEHDLCYHDKDVNPSLAIEESAKFDLIILSDLVFNHTEHIKLLTNCRNSLKKTGTVLVVFSPHRPKLLSDDLKFFETAKDFQLAPELIEMVNWKPMFDEDEETVEIRSRVYSYKLIPVW